MHHDLLGYSLDTKKQFPGEVYWIIFRLCIYPTVPWVNAYTAFEMYKGCSFWEFEVNETDWPKMQIWSDLVFA